MIPKFGNFSSVLSDEKRFPIYELKSFEDVQEYIWNKNPFFYTLDNQILRCFFVKTLGEFSSTFNGIVAGYVYDFGFFISIVIVFLISTQSVYLSKYLQRKSQIYFQIFIVLYLMIPALFFAGNVFLYEFYSISILLFREERT